VALRKPFQFSPDGRTTRGVPLRGVIALLGLATAAGVAGLPIHAPATWRWIISPGLTTATLSGLLLFQRRQTQSMQRIRRKLGELSRSGLRSDANTSHREREAHLRLPVHLSAVGVPETGVRTLLDLWAQRCRSRRRMRSAPRITTNTRSWFPRKRSGLRSR